MNKIKQKVGGRGQSDIAVLKERFGQMQSSANTNPSSPTQQSTQPTMPPASQIRQQAPSSQPVVPPQQRPQQQPQQYSQPQPNNPGQPTNAPQHLQPLTNQQPYSTTSIPSSTASLAMQASHQTVQSIPQDSPLPDAVTMMAAGQGKNPFEALAQTPNQKGNIQFVELEGQAGSIINQAVIDQNNPQQPQPNVQNIHNTNPQPGQQNTPQPTTNPQSPIHTTGSESIIEESLEELRAEYDDTKLNSIIIDQVKELIEIDNNLNKKIEDVRTDLKKETDERLKLVKVMDERYKELKELEESIQKFIALYEVVTNQFNPFIKQSPEADARMQELTQGKPAARAVHESQHFVSKNGAKVGTIGDLISIIQSMNDEEFRHHVTPVKNDFAIWIHDTFKDEELAQQVSTHRTKEGILKTLASHV